jgi:drug/metabolite transporter (DMT)-like permease
MRDYGLASNTTMEDEVTRFKTTGAFLAIYLIWGSTYLGIRYAVETLPPLLMMGLRHVVAGGLLYAWVRMRGGPAPERRLWVPAAIAAVFCFLGGHGLLAWAEQRVSSGLAALLLATEPLIMVVLARLAGQERLSLRTLIALALGLAGIALLFDTGAKQSGVLASAAVLLSSVAWSVGAIYARSYTRSSASLFAAMQMLMGGVLLLVVGAVAGQRLHLATVSSRSWAALLYLIIFGSILAFGAYTWLMRVSTAAKVSTHAYVNPVVAVFLGWALAREPVTPVMLLGMAIVVVSVVLVTIKRQDSGNLRQDFIQQAAAD